MTERETDGLSPAGHRRIVLRWMGVAIVATVTAAVLDAARTWTRTPTCSTTFDDAPLRRATGGTR